MEQQRPTERPRTGQNYRQNNQKKRSFYFRKKVCLVCQKSLEDEIDYKNVMFLRKFVTEKGKIIPRRLSGACAKHQRVLTRSIKQARTIALLPFTQL